METLDLLATAGIEQPATLVRPLLTAALDNVLAMGDDALTGPVMGRPKSATYRTADLVGLDTLAFVANTDVKNLGIFGLLFLLFTLVKVLTNVEGAFNEIWGVVQSRGWVRRFADYLTVLIVAPILTASALSPMWSQCR